MINSRPTVWTLYLAPCTKARVPSCVIFSCSPCILSTYSFSFLFLYHFFTYPPSPFLLLPLPSLPLSHSNVSPVYFFHAKISKWLLYVYRVRWGGGVKGARKNPLNIHFPPPPTHTPCLYLPFFLSFFFNFFFRNLYLKFIIIYYIYLFFFFLVKSFLNIFFFFSCIFFKKNYTLFFVLPFIVIYHGIWKFLYYNKLYFLFFYHYCFFKN